MTNLCLLPRSIQQHIINFLCENEIEYNGNQDVFRKTIKEYLNNLLEDEKYMSPFNFYIRDTIKTINNMDLYCLSMCNKKSYELCYNKYLSSNLIPWTDDSKKIKCLIAVCSPIEPTTIDIQRTEVNEIIFSFPKNAKKVVFNDDFNDSLLFDKSNGLMHIVLGAQFNKTIKQLPKTSQILEFPFSSQYDQPLLKNVLPESLKYLKFGSSFNQLINESESVLPQGLVSLIFGYNFNQIIDLRAFDELRDLVFGFNFNKPLCKLPKKVRTLIFNGMFNQLIEKNILSEKLTKLIFSTKFNQPLDIGVLPDTITYLHFGCEYNQPFSQGVLPQELLELKLGHHFNQRLDKFILPNKLLKLQLGYTFNQKLISGSLPEKLECLLMNDSYDNIFDPMTLPSNLVELSCPLETVL